MALDAEQPRLDRSPAERAVPRRVFEANGTPGSAWRTALATCRLRAEGARQTSEVMLDSFDRRLWRAGLRLTASGAAPTVHCHLQDAREPAAETRAAGTNPRSADLELTRLPAFVWDFPSPLAARLVAELEARRLDPIATHVARLERWAVLDEQEKTVAWIEEAQHEVTPARSRSGRPVRAKRVQLCAVRGYEREFEALAEALAAVAGLTTTADESFDPQMLLGRPTRRPGRWPVLQPDVGALEGLTRILRAQLVLLRANDAGLRQQRDAEFLHDARVALRRMRSLIGQLGSILARSERDFLGPELRWLASCTGPARDLDTLILELRLTEPELRADLGPALLELEGARARAQAALVAQLDSERHAVLRERLQAAFGMRTNPTLAGKRALEPFARVLAKRLRRRMRQVATRAGNLAPSSPALDLHELRIACKKLRYLLECCRGLVPRDALAGVTARLKALQGALGTVQDAEVHAQLVRQHLLASEALGPRAHLALGRFLERSARQAESARQRYGELAARLLARDDQADFARLLEALEPSEEPA